MSEHAQTETIVVAAPPEVVWAVMSDVAQWPTWTASVQQVELLGPTPLQVGSQVRIRQPRLPATTWLVERLTPGVAFSWTSSRPGMRTVGEHAVTPVPEGSRVDLALRLTGPAAGLTGRLSRGLVQRYMRMEAEGLRRHAEQRHATPHSD